MKLLELFAGTRSVGKEAEKLGFEVYSSDIEPFDKIDYVVDILNFDINKIPFKPTVIWASVPCTTYSILQVRHHRDGIKPKTDDAILGDKITVKTLEIIKQLNPKYWYIENPRGMLRKMPFMLGLPRTTVWYCQYGDNRAKPTDIWSNNLYSLFNPDGWQPKPVCHNGNENCHHDAAPRGCTTGGVQGQSSNKTRSVIPKDLCREIMQNSI
jgi:site-specific DNA-cytosine methylase